MRVKSFLVSFLVSFLFVCFCFQLSAETVTLKTYPTIQTNQERNLKNAEQMKALREEAKRKNDLLK